MNQKKVNFIIALIAVTTVITLAIQFYWNYENYRTNEQFIYNEIHSSFNETVDYHYEQTSKNKFLYLIDTKSGDSLDTSEGDNSFFEDFSFEKLLPKIDSSKNEFVLNQDDSLSANPSIEIIIGKQTKIAREELEQYKNQVTLEIHQDTVDFELLNKVLKEKLSQRKLNTNYLIQHYKSDTLFAQTGYLNSSESIVETFSTSELIPSNQDLKLTFQNPSTAIFRRGLFGILLSLALAACIIFSLFYLIHIINKQKQLAEIKNDLISNITHEFRTPIATAMAAMEGATSFNETNDPIKNLKYLDVSKDQLLKLDEMVEKLLETAALDSKNLELKKTEIDIVPIIDKMVKQYKNTYPNKEFIQLVNISSVLCDIDLFHFENVINNIIDNAVKYGGDIIKVLIAFENEHTIISITDNGGIIPLKEQSKIFEKFYRVPSGNKHDVKGFGIGLYYSQNVIEKHGGSLTLKSNLNNGTEFKIIL